MNNHIHNLIAVAKQWQEHHHRDKPNIIKKIKEEIDEWHNAKSNLESLDEFGDILVAAMRLLVELKPKELRLIVMLAEYKAHQRIRFDIKDKEDEARMRADAAHLVGVE